MRIVSEFRDYYDSAVPYNDSCVWNRKTYKLVFDKTKRNEWFDYNQMTFLEKLWDNRPVVNGDDDSIIFGICGEILPVVLLKDISKKELINTSYEHYLSRIRGNRLLNISAHYNYDDYLIKRNKTYPDTILNGEKLSRSYTSFHSLFGKSLLSSKNAVDDWKASHLNPRDMQNIFISISTPIFIISRIDNETVMTINPKLKEYGIQNLYDPWTMYQKIEQYLSNELVDLKFPPFEMSNELKRDAHGFDDKSFKNEKGHKKRKNLI